MKLKNISPIGGPTEWFVSGANVWVIPLKKNEEYAVGIGNTVTEALENGISSFDVQDSLLPVQDSVKEPLEDVSNTPESEVTSDSAITDDKLQYAVSEMEETSTDTIIMPIEEPGEEPQNENSLNPSPQPVPDPASPEVQKRLALGDTTEMAFGPAIGKKLKDCTPDELKMAFNLIDPNTQDFLYLKNAILNYCWATGISLQ